ncbi:MAG: metallophosphoesterase [Desulfobacteraceae bacterium]|jgi:hypothetical protein
MSGKGIKEKVTLKKGEKLLLELKHVDAIILSPSLGCPAIVRRKDDGTAFLELLIVCKNAVLTPAQVAYHVRFVPWQEKDRPGRYNQKTLKLFESYFMDVVLPVPVEKMVKISKCYTWNEDTFGLGDRGCDIEDKEFDFKLSMSNVFDWVMKEYGLKGYKHLFKVAINLDYEDVSDEILYNVIWFEKEAAKKAQKKPSLARAIQVYIKNRVDKITSVFKEKGLQYTFRTQLADYGGVEEDSKDNILVSMYHPVYVTAKKEFNIGHVTDIHLDTRMEMYTQCEASVIEVKENCAANLTFNKQGRVTPNNEFHEPIKKKVANFNGFFVDICKRLVDKGADFLVITGDLVDYNQSPHTAQTFQKKPEKPGEAWTSLNKSSKDHKQDRNWLQFYKNLLTLYNEGKKPVFTLLGNHDYAKYAMAPWPFFKVFWNGVYDQNLSRYETALMFGEHDPKKVFGIDTDYTKFSFGEGFDYNLNHDYKTDFEFFGDFFGFGSCVLWYSFFINPFADYVVDLGRQSLLMVDWGCTSAMVRNAVKGMGGLHHAVHVFKNKMDYGNMVDTKEGPKYKKTWMNIGNSPELPPPFNIRSGSIYDHWVLNKSHNTKILFMHPTVICPRDDVSEWEVENHHSTKDNKLQYGSFNHRRDKILADIEHGHLHMAVSGHSHRNMAMEVSESRHDKARVLSAGEVLMTEFREARHLVLVTSSAGPLPTFLPGAPLVCGCTKENRYNTGYFFEDIKNRLLTLDEHHRTVTVPKGKDGKPCCPHCGMHAFDMKRKPYKRHRPGGNLLTFQNGKVSIRTVPVQHSLSMPSKPRIGPMCEEWGVMVEDMVLEKIKNERDFSKYLYFQPVNIISRFPFKRYTHMEFPTHVTYVTFDMGNLAKLVKSGSLDKVGFVLEKDMPFGVRVGQTVIKKPFEYFMKSALSRRSMAFMRYSFGPHQYWDREIAITKHLLGKTKDLARKAKAGSQNAYEKMKSMISDHEPKTYIAKYDEFEDMIVVFKKHPDFRKRKDPNVCGY